MSTHPPSGHRLERNLTLFIAFRVLFHARFYYPVIGVLFLDLGLTLEQYGLLNVVWALAIVLAEIPSGALADSWGRKKMVVLAAALMVVEMALLAFAPTGHPGWLFTLLLANRIVSGLAEAASSGADEALAYDSLPAENREETWAHVLERLMRWKSAAFVIAMLVGAALFDQAFLESWWLRFGGTEWTWTTTRWPVLASLLASIVCLGVALSFTEPPPTAAAPSPTPAQDSTALKMWRSIRTGARHVLTVRRVTLLLAAALLLDSFVRLFLTFASNYYRLITLPEVTNGIWGAALALLGFAVAPVARRLVLRARAVPIFAGIFALVFLGLWGLASAVPIWGLWVLLPLGLSLSGLQYFTSYYLNQWTDSSMRATVLSFRGVAFNLAYGTVGLAFAGWISLLRQGETAATENQLFSQALGWLPGAFLVSCVFWLILARWTRSRSPSAPPAK